MPGIVPGELIRFCSQILFGNEIFFFSECVFSFNKFLSLLKKPTLSFKIFFEMLVPEFEQCPLFTTELHQFNFFSGS